MKKLYAPFAIAISVSGFLFFGLLWINNLFSAWRYHQALFLGQNIADAVFPGFWPALNWSTVDVSCVTTFVPFFGFFLILYGLFHVSTRDNWPFFHSYDQLNIALGLLGTIWGIILVGYFPPGQITIVSLMICLHTAMFSTLAAVAWVMVLKPMLIMPGMRIYRRILRGEENVPDDFSELADDFVGKVVRAGDSLGKAAGEAAEFSRELRNNISPVREVASEMKTLCDSLKAARESEKNWQASAVETMKRLDETGRELAGVLAVLQEENRKLKKDFTEAESRLVFLEKEKAVLTADNRALAARNAEMEESSGKLAQTLDQVRDALR